MKNREAVKHVYDEIHAPEALSGKVMEMDKKQSKVRNIVKYAMGTAAALALAFVTSNGICYAATGQTWVSKAIVYINGETMEQELEWHQEGDLLYSTIELPVEEGDGARVEVYSFVTDREQPVEQMMIMSDSTLEKAINEGAITGTEDALLAELLQEEGKVYLVTPEEKIDITEDFRDGKASGTFACGTLYLTYKVTGTVEEHEISLSDE